MNKIIESAVNWAIATANDNSHGYSQADRWGPDYDCSSFVITAYQQAGVPVKDKGATYTGNMRIPFIACGFVDVTNRVGLKTGYGIEAGDVLLNYSAHTCIAIGDGKVANCRTAEGHPQSGDQSGNEIRIQPYWNYPWNCVLRLKQSTAEQQQEAEKEPETVVVNHDLKLPVVKLYSKGDAVALRQAALNLRGFNCGEIDGDFGPKTQAALNQFQKWAGIAVDGICGKETDSKLFEMK